MKFNHLLSVVNEKALIEAAKDRYAMMFQNLPEEIQDSASAVLEQGMKIFKREDRIVWYLRLMKLNMIGWLLNRKMEQLEKTKGEPPAPTGKKDLDHVRALQYQAAPAASGVDQAQAEKDQISALYNKELQKFMKKANVDHTTAIGMYSQASSNAFRNAMEHFFSLPINEIQTFQFAYQAPQDIWQHFTEIENEWKKGRAELIDMSDDEGVEKIMEFPDGSAWFNLSRGYCKIEGDAMGHCGNAGARDEDDTVLSYRMPQTDSKHGSNMWKPHLTFILNQRTGMLGEMKGRANQKPAEKYHPVIVELLKQPFIKGIRGGGYLPENNFSLSDLDEDVAEQLAEMKPALATPRYEFKKAGATPELMERVNSMLGDYNYDPVEFDKNYNGFILFSESPTTLLRRHGGSTGEWVADIIDGEKEFHSYYDYAPASTEKADLLDAVEKRFPDLYLQIRQYVFDEYGKDYDVEEPSELDSTEIVEILDTEGEELGSQLAWSVHDGLAMGAESEMYDSAKSWWRNPSDGVDTIWDENLDGELSVYASADAFFDMLENEDDLEYNNGSWGDMIDFHELTEPYMGWSGFDEEGAVEAFYNMADVPKSVKDKDNEAA